MENTTKITSEEAMWERINEYSNEVQNDLANNIRDIYRSALVKRDIRTMEELRAVQVKIRDLVITGSAEKRNQSVWVVLGNDKCLLLAGQETEDVDWFFKFGGIDIYRLG